MIRAALVTTALAAIYAGLRFHRAWTAAWVADKTSYDAMTEREYLSEQDK